MTPLRLLLTAAIGFIALVAPALLLFILACGVAVPSVMLLRWAVLLQARRTERLAPAPA